VIRSSVRVFDTFPEITKAVDELARDAVNAGAAEAAAVAKEAGADRGLTDLEVVPAHGGEDGWVAGVKAPYYYRFQSYGTLGKAVHARRPGTKRSHEPGTGITPNLMFQRARSAGRKAIIARLRRGLR
jgi:hypothetical protein